MYSTLPSFDELLTLAKSDPEGLEQLRYTLCEEVINNAPDRLKPKLRGLLFKVDVVRSQSKNPVASCIKISNLMHDHYNQLVDVLVSGKIPTTHNDQSAKILPFRRKEQSS